MCVCTYIYDMDKCDDPKYRPQRLRKENERDEECSSNFETITETFGLDEDSLRQITCFITIAFELVVPESIKNNH